MKHRAAFAGSIFATCTTCATLALAGCSAPPTPVPTPTTAPTAEVPVNNAERAKDTELPSGSGDYRATLALARRFQDKQLDFDGLLASVKHLKPHDLGDGYLMIPVPMPPPGIEWNPRMMPKDWEGNWGEVAMTYWIGAITLDEYNRLHKAAHPACPAT